MKYQSRQRLNYTKERTNSHFFLYFYPGQCEEVDKAEGMCSYKLFVSVVLLCRKDLNFGSFVFQPAGIFTHRQLL
jgi:hypothetical protein